MLFYLSLYALDITNRMQCNDVDGQVRARMTNQFRAVSASRLMLPGGLVMNPVYPGQPRHQHQLSSDHTYYNTPSHAHASNQAGHNIMRHSRPEV